MTNKQIRSWALKLHYEIINYRGNDPMKKLTKLLHKSRINPILYIEKIIKKIIKEEKQCQQ